MVIAAGMTGENIAATRLPHIHQTNAERIYREEIISMLQEVVKTTPCKKDYLPGNQVLIQNIQQALEDLKV